MLFCKDCTEVSFAALISQKTAVVLTVGLLPAHTQAHTEDILMLLNVGYALYVNSLTKYVDIQYRVPQHGDHRHRSTG